MFRCIELLLYTKYMSYVSKKALSPDVKKRIHDNIIRTIAKSDTKREAVDLLEELLTDTERLMLAKRLAMIFMLAEDISPYRIHKTLLVSRSTAYRFAKEVDSGKYSYLQKIVKQKRIREDLWDDIEKLLRAGLPPIAGRGRWSVLVELSKRKK